MGICTFFVHRDSPEELMPELRCEVEKLIRSGEAQIFYVGNQGRFDGMALRVLREMKERYPFIRYAVVLAYLPTGKAGQEETFLPEGIETVPRRFAISFRNRWMLRQAQSVIVNVEHSWGGAAQAAQSAERLGKRVIYLGKIRE